MGHLFLVIVFVLAAVFAPRFIPATKIGWLKITVRVGAGVIALFLVLYSYSNLTSTLPALIRGDGTNRPSEAVHKHSLSKDFRWQGPFSEGTSGGCASANHGSLQTCRSDVHVSSVDGTGGAAVGAQKGPSAKRVVLSVEESAP